MSSSSTRNDVVKLAESIEGLAREVQTQLQNNGPFLATANELVRTNLTLVFALGEVYATEKSTGKPVKATAVSGLSSNRHSYRDTFGRFAKKP